MSSYSVFNVSNGIMLESESMFGVVGVIILIGVIGAIIYAVYQMING